MTQNTRNDLAALLAHAAKSPAVKATRTAIDALLNDNPGTCTLLAGTTYSFTPDNGYGWAMVDVGDPRLTLAP